jgi:hypothetical protein
MKLLTVACGHRNVYCIPGRLGSGWKKMRSISMVTSCKQMSNEICRKVETSNLDILELLEACMKDRDLNEYDIS